jgi:hypothetical protein
LNDGPSGDLRPDLPDVTLVAVTSVALDQTLDALRASMGQVRCGKVLLLSDQPPKGAHQGIEWRPTRPITSRADYSRFMLRELFGHIETSHALCIQWDGYVLDGGRWNPRFLDFDYIGAPWPHFHDEYNVGNGGFSLRSRRLLDACRKLPLEAVGAEDVLIARVFRPLLEQQGMRFAGESLAREFSYERTAKTGREFGFHGAFNLVRLISPKEAIDLFRNLEPMVLARSERWELFRWAFLHGRWKVAAALLLRLM